MTAKKTTNVLIAKETMALVSRDCEVQKKEKEITKLKHTQNITYPEARRMVDLQNMQKWQRKCPNNQKTKLLYMWNKCNHKTQGGCPACKWNESADPGDENYYRCRWKTLWRPRVATSQERQAKPDWKSSGALTSEVTSVAGPLQSPPKSKTNGNSPPWRAGTWYKTGKNKSSSRTKTTPRKDRFEPMEMETSICQTGKIQMNTKMKNQEEHSKCPQEQSHLYESNNVQGSTKPLWKIYSIESMDSDTDCIVASLNLEVLNNYNTWNY